MIYNFKNKDFEFTLFVGDIFSRFNGEGLLQMIYLEVNGYRLLETHWGVNNFFEEISLSHEDISFHDKYNYDYFLSENSFYFKLNPLDEHTVFIDNDFIEFKNWLLSILFPKTEGRKLKINKLKEKICYIKNT